MYSIKEAAAELRVSYRTVYNWVKERKIVAYPKDPFVESGSEYMIPESEIARVERLRRGE